MTNKHPHPHVYPADFVKPAGQQSIHQGDEQKPALIILNQPIADITILDRLWKNTSYHVCADGGANRLYHLFEQNAPLELDDYLPDIIHGDLDSLRGHVRAHYRNMGVSITQDPDQYSTDFAKAIKQVLREQPWQRSFVVLGTIAGRVDQGIGLLSEMYREQHSKLHANIQFWLFSESSISFILAPGTTTIHTPLAENVLTSNVGLLPIFGPAHITTQGLEWDVENWQTQMGGQVSTSNHIVKDQITISTDAHVLFTVERMTSLVG